MQPFLKKIFILLSIGTILLGAHTFVRAETENELRTKILKTEDKIKQMEQEITQYKNDLEKIATLKKSLKSLIAELETTRKKLDAEIRITATKVDNTELKIRELGNEINYKEDLISLQEAGLVEALRALYERDNQTLPEVVLSQESFSGLWGDIEAIGQFSDTVRVNTETLKVIKAELEKKQTVRQTEKRSLLDLKEELSDRKKIAEDTKKKNATLLAQTNNKESAYTKLLNQKIALKEAFEKELSDYESTLKFILDPTSIPSRGTKVFSPPVDNVYITGKFGASSATNSSGQRLYAKGTHNGTDFRASVGTPVRAMLGGTIVGTGDTDLTCPGASFGRWILIDYNNGLASTYAHLSLIKVNVGDTVTAGQVVGYSGGLTGAPGAGWSTGPHLHVSVYARKAVDVKTRDSSGCPGRIYTMPIAALNGYLDPMDYL